MLTGIPSNVRAFPRLARPALLLVGCLLSAGSIYWIRLSRPDSELEPSAVGPAAPQTAREPRIGGEEPSDPANISGPRDQQQRGKKIYSTGISPIGGKMTAALGDSTSEIPAVALRCINCHLQDGSGKPEGGITPSNIQWDELTKPYGSINARGRKRPPYDVRLLKRAITMGLDSAGMPLDRAMPRYRMTHEDLADLVAYLMALGRESDPGVFEDRVRIGVIVPPARLFPEMGLAVRAALTAFVSEINRSGGIYRRAIELCFTESPVRREDRAEAAIAFAKREQVFALAASFIAGVETEVARRLDEEGVPIIGPQTLFPQTGFPLNRRVFYLTSGLQGQSRALIRYARDHCPVEARKTVLLFPQHKQRSDEGLADDALEQVAKSIDAGFVESGWPMQLCATSPLGFDPKLLAQRLAEQKTSIVFSLLTAEQNVQLLQAAVSHHWYPRFCVAGNLVGPEIFDAPTQFDGRIFLSFGNLPSKQPVGIRAYNTLAEEFHLPSGQLATQFEALAAMKALVQALQQSGASVSRERMIEQLETFHEYRTGFAPPLTFGPNRRVGANGAYVVRMDLINKKLVPVSDWVEGLATSQSDL